MLCFPFVCVGMFHRVSRQLCARSSHLELISVLLGIGYPHPWHCELRVPYHPFSCLLTTIQDSEIRNNAASYLSEISQLLNHVPRQMLLILKTNDLLRSIETTLGTRSSASSFLNMSRCCIRALAE